MADDDEDDGRIPGPVIMFAVGLVAIGLGLALALAECSGAVGSDARDPVGGFVIHG